MSDQKVLDRRGFLKGSAIFAAVAGLSAAIPASAQEPAKPADAEKTETKEEPKKDSGAAEQGGDTRAKLYDKQGREYRVCDMCGGSMYLTEKMWTCEQCGFSYEV
jgi:anaerobic selenocysteine-containing dehydrogenase